MKKKRPEGCICRENLKWNLLFLEIDILEHVTLCLCPVIFAKVFFIAMQEIYKNPLFILSFDVSW